MSLRFPCTHYGTSPSGTPHPFYLQPHCCPPLTPRGDHADNDGGGSAGALNQDGDQDSHHKPRYWVGEDGVVLENVPCDFT